MEAKSNTVGGFQIPEMQIGVIEGDLARIHKQGHIEGGSGLPSVLGA